MGYMSEIEINVKVRPEELKSFRRAVGRETGVVRTWPTRRQRACRWMLYDLDISDDGTIGFRNPWGKWYQDIDFVDFLKRFVTKGTVRFHGDDGAIWGYLFNGNGGVKPLDSRTEGAG